LLKEKEFTLLRDELSRERRELPWLRVEKQYVFDAPEGKQTLADLFDRRSQLIVYHFMLGPGWKAGCVGARSLPTMLTVPTCTSHTTTFHLSRFRVHRLPRSKPTKSEWVRASSGFPPTAKTSTTIITCHSRKTKWRRARSTTTTK
jgi:predicted dithiol-disulfide oxidoreductase (DUF899 family)